MEKYDTARQVTEDNIIRRMRTACRITKTTETQYVIIFACPLQHCLHQRASLLGYTHIACVFKHNNDLIKSQDTAVDLVTTKRHR